LVTSASVWANNYYVDLDWTGTASGTQTEPFKAISNATETARLVSGTHNIYIAAGTYADVANGGTEDFNAYIGQNGSVAANGGGYPLGNWSGWGVSSLVNVYGGYAGWQGGSTFDWTEGSRVPRSTIIDLQGANSRAFFNNAYLNAGSALIDGFTFVNGNVSGGTTISYAGGAVLNGTPNWGANGQSIYINNCLFSNNVSTAGGGAVGFYAGNGGWVKNSEFINNRTKHASGLGGGGGAVCVSSESGLLFANCLFRGNMATNYGGSLYGEAGAIKLNGNATVSNCVFEGNAAGQHAGALWMYNSVASGLATVRECVFRGNAAPQGAAIGGSDSGGWAQGAYDVRNCLIVSNTGGYAVQVDAGSVPAGATYTLDMLHCTVADNPQGGVLAKDATAAKPMRVRNSIVVNNGAYGINRADATDTAPDLANNDVYNNTSGNYSSATPDANSISSDPLFINVAAANYHLFPNSPCVGTASNLSVAVDLDGNARTAPHSMGALLAQVPGTLTTEAATGIATNAATLNGVISSVGVTPTDVTVYWGDEDSGTTGTWDNVVALTTPAFDRNNPVGPVSNALSLASQRVYYFRHSLSNSIGVQWSPATKSFLAGEVTVATIADASEAGISGTFRVTRPTGATNGAIPVYYTTGGSAKAGTNYVSIGTNTVIPDGSNSVDIVVTPINDPVSTTNETLTLTLAAGLYVIGTPSTASMTISNFAPEDVTLTASDAAASENGPDSGTFLFTRSGSAAITINYTVSGTASNTDYTPVPGGSITIPAGQGSTNFVIWPVVDGYTNEGPETVTLTLAAGTYNIASPSNGTVTIANYVPVGNDICVDLDWTHPAGGCGQTNNPFTTIRAAVNFANAVPGTHNIYIAAGTYNDVANGGTENFDAYIGGGAGYTAPGGGYPLGNWSTWGVSSLVNVYGGYAGWQGGSTFDWTEGSRVPRSTVIDLQGANSRAFFNNAYLTGSALIDGFTFVNGSVSGGTTINYAGGAVLNGNPQAGASGQSIYINNCLFSNNVSTAGGGAVGFFGGPGGWVKNSEFINNRTLHASGLGGGGGAVCVSSDPGLLFANCLFRGNMATNYGGYFYGEAGAIKLSWDATVSNCVFEGNAAGQHAGALWMYNSVASGLATVRECVFRGNSAPQGAAIGGSDFGGWSQGAYDIRNCLIVSNTGGYAVQVDASAVPAGTTYTLDMLHCTVAANPQGGVLAKDASTNKPMRVRNSIVVNNGAYGVFETDATDTAPTLANNDVWSNTSGNYSNATPDGASISADPKFMDGTNFHLALGSPCRDSGASGLGLTVDLEGTPRPFNAGDTGVDMGCYEHLPPPRGTSFAFR
jgi:hypothetical protein